MALPKKIKIGGALVQGYQLGVAGAAGDYVKHITMTKDFVVSGIEILVDDSGAGDYFTITHVDTTAASGVTIDTLATSIYNPGPGRSWTYDLPAAEPFKPNESMKVVYTNAGGVAIDCRINVTFIR
jgi:hypothetical protein